MVKSRIVVIDDFRCLLLANIAIDEFIGTNDLVVKKFLLEHTPSYVTK